MRASERRKGEEHARGYPKSSFQKKVIDRVKLGGAGRS
jgi:hypothetical protein